VIANLLIQCGLYLVVLLALARPLGAFFAQVAFDAGALTYRAVKAYLDRNASPPISLRQIDPLIRDLTEYRDLVCRITQGETP